MISWYHVIVSVIFFLQAYELSNIVSKPKVSVSRGIFLRSISGVYNYVLRNKQQAKAAVAAVYGVQKKLDGSRIHSTATYIL